MSNLILLLVLALGGTDGDPALAEASEAPERFPLEVFAYSPQGEYLAGVQLSLCPLDRDDSTDLEDDSDLCFQEFTLQLGRGVFSSVARGRYRLRGRLSGMATTTLSPIEIPLSVRNPDRVVMILNPTNACRGGG